MHNPDMQTADREIVSARVFDFPRERVFGAFTDPVQLAKWWGPKGFTNTFDEFDLRPGGAWRFTMHSPTGADYRNHSVFLEIVRPERIVFDHLETVHRFRMTMTFVEEAADKTRLTWQMLFGSADEVTKLRDFISEANGQNFDRLEAELIHMSASAHKND